MTPIKYRSIHMGNKIVHFEIPVGDTEKMSKFYSELFGWKFSKAPMEGMEYWMISMTGKDADLAGGMYKKQEESERPRFYVEVDNIDDHTESFKQAGGTVIVEKQEIPGTGFTVLGTDPEGNTLGLFQPKRAVPKKRKAPTKKKKSRK
ncbi:MAG: VOC family protein [Nitrososphaerales archaeon]